MMLRRTKELHLIMALIGLIFLPLGCIFGVANPPPPNPTEGQEWIFTDRLLDFSLKPDKTLDILYFRSHTVKVPYYKQISESEVIDWEAMLHKGHNYKVVFTFINSNWSISIIQDLDLK